MIFKMIFIATGFDIEWMIGTTTFAAGFTASADESARTNRR